MSAIIRTKSTLESSRSELKAIVDRAASIKPDDNADMTVEELQALYDYAKEHPGEALMLAFWFGFANGRRE